MNEYNYIMIVLFIIFHSRIILIVFLPIFINSSNLKKLNSLRNSDIDEFSLKDESLNFNIQYLRASPSFVKPKVYSFSFGCSGRDFNTYGYGFGYGYGS